MKNLQNIIGGERNFLFSDKNIFLGNLKFSLEKRIIFDSIDLLSPENYELGDVKDFDTKYNGEKKLEEKTPKEKTLKENVIEKTRIELDKIKNLKKDNNNKDIYNNLNNYLKKLFLDETDIQIKEQSSNGVKKTNKEINDQIEAVDEKLKSIENLKIQIESKKEKLITNKLSIVYGNWSKTVSDISDKSFKYFLKEVFNIPMNQTGPLNLNRAKLNTDSSSYKKLNKSSKKIIDELGKMTEEGLTVFDLKISDTNLSEISQTGKIYMSSYENNDEGTLNQAVAMLKKTDFSTLLESNAGVVTTGIALTALYKLTGGGNGFYSVIGGLASIFGLNTITKGGFLDFLGNKRDEVIEEFKNNPFVDKMQDQLNLKNSELKIFKEISRGKTQTYLGDITIIGNYSDLLKMAKGKNNVGDTKKNLKGCPAGIDQKYYASTLIKIFADKGGYNFPDRDESWYELEQTEELGSNQEESFNIGKVKIKEDNYPSMMANLTLDIEKTNYDKIKEFFGDKWEDAKEGLKESGFLDYTNENINNFKELWGASVLFNYDKDTGKIKIFSSKENKGSKNIIVETVDGGFRMFRGGIEITKNVIYDIFTNSESSQKVYNSIYAINRIEGINTMQMETNLFDSDKTNNQKMVLEVLGKFLKQNPQIKVNYKKDGNNDKFSFGDKELTINNKISGGSLTSSKIMISDSKNKNQDKTINKNDISEIKKSLNIT